MIRHIVMFKLKNEGDKLSNLEEAKERLLSLKNKISYIRSIEVGINDEKADDNNYDLVLTVDVDNIEKLNDYQIHPDHQEVVVFLKKLVESRACVDYTI